MSVTVTEAGRGGAALPLLTRFGLSVQADLVYRYLALTGAQKPTTLATALDLHATRVLVALEELEEGGAVVLVGTDARRGLWTARPPDEVLARLRVHREWLARARHTLSRSLSIVDVAGVDLDRLRDAAPVADVAVARRRFHEAIASATSECLAMNPEPTFTPAAARAATPVGLSALRNGARTMSLGVPAAVEDVSHLHSARMYAHDRHDYRELPRQPVKLTVVDRRVAFFPIDPSRDYQGGVWEISTPSIVDEMTAFFLRRWEGAMPPRDRWRPPRQLSERERAVLVALAQGDTDEMAAQRLALSSRTIRYVIRDLMDRYQVQTRFQLGLIVGRLDQEDA